MNNILLFLINWLLNAVTQSQEKCVAYRPLWDDMAGILEIVYLYISNFIVFNCHARRDIEEYACCDCQ
jgi:hypothetical protein